jgi:hypothetical protein
MKKTLLTAFVLFATGVLTSPARSQGPTDGMLVRMVSWFTGDPDVLYGPPSALLGPPNSAEDTCCDSGCCGCCSACCHQHDVWGSVEFLMWWGKGTSLPPLVTTSPVGTPQTNAGVLGFPSTSVLFGDEMAGNKLQGGGRVTAGIWLDPDHNVAAGGRFFGLGGDTDRFAQNSPTGDPILGIPFFNALLDQPDALLLAFPGLSRGGINAYLSTNNVIGAEAFAEIMMLRDARRRIDLVGGYQFFRMDDWLQINSTSTLTQAGNPFAGLQIDVRDRFSTRNEFHGGEVGLRGRLAHGMWSLNVLGQVGLGNMNQTVTINGTTGVTPPGGGATAVSTGGLFAQESNIGVYQQNKFVFLPQLIANLNYHLNPNLSFHVGYNLLWISDVALSADQIDTAVNLNQPVGPIRPAFAFQDRDYWFQGINLGMNWDF